MPVMRMLVICIVLMCQAVLAVHKVVLVSFSNETHISRLDSVPKVMQAVFPSRFHNYGMHFSVSGVANDNELIPGPGISLLKVYLLNFNEPRLRFMLATGAENRTLTREFPVDPAENLESFLAVMLTKILHIFEEDVLSRVQIVSEPLRASLVIDSMVTAHTPYESYLPEGLHHLELKANGYLPLHQAVNVTPGNNRFGFTLKPVPSPEQPFAAPSFLKKHTWVLLAGALVFTGITGYSHSGYISSDDEYDILVSRNSALYNDLDRKAGVYLTVRNFSAGGAVLLSIYYAYLKLIG